MPRSPSFKYDRNLGEILSANRKPEVPPDTSWYKVGSTEVFGIPFENGWDHVGGTNPPVSQYLSEDGETRFRGKAKGGDIGTVMFTLPEELRPEYSETFIVPIEDLSGVRRAGFVDVKNDGRVIFAGEIFAPNTARLGISEYFSIFNVSNSEVARIDPLGNLHMKTGATIVFDLP